MLARDLRAAFSKYSLPGKDPNAISDDANKDPTPDEGYDALLAQGMSHPEIVDHLARRVLRILDEQAELKNSRELADLGMSIVENLPTIYENNEWGDAPNYLDPERIPVVLVVHPAGITPEAEFALDQYLIRGGNVIACIDSLSLAAQQTAQQPQFPGMPPQGGTPTVSTLPQLFEI